MPVPIWAEGGSVSHGWFGVLADEACGQSVSRTINQDEDIRTVDLRLDAVSGLPSPGCLVRARGEAVVVGDSMTRLSRAALCGPGGETVAVSTARFMVVSREDAVWSFEGDASATGRDRDGEALNHTEGDSVEFADRSVVVTLEPSIAICNRYGFVHGGFHVTLIENAMHSLLVHRLPRVDRALMTLSVNYYKPIALEGNPAITIRAEVDRLGRRSASLSAEIVSDLGKVLTTAHGSFRLGA